MPVVAKMSHWFSKSVAATCVCFLLFSPKSSRLRRLPSWPFIYYIRSNAGRQRRVSAVFMSGLHGANASEMSLWLQLARNQHIKEHFCCDE